MVASTPGTRLIFGARAWLLIIPLDARKTDRTEPSATEAGDPAATEEWDMQERRSFPRTVLELPVHLTVVPNGGDSEAFAGCLKGTTRDVSRGGCALLADTEVTERTRCLARFPMATGCIDPDTVWAEVRRSHRQDGGVLLGLEFDTPLDTLRIAPDAVETTAGYKARPRRILVVDDKPGIRGLLTRYLGDRGFDVDTAGDGEEAFRKVMNEPPDVMLLDLYLPRLNGHDLLRRMREMNIAIELIFTMSGYAHTSDAQECLRLGAIDHLLKPLDLEHLHRSIVLRLGAHPA